MPPRFDHTTLSSQYFLLLDHGFVENTSSRRPADGNPMSLYCPQHRASQPAPRASGYRYKSFLNKVRPGGGGRGGEEGREELEHREQPLSSRELQQHAGLRMPTERMSGMHSSDLGESIRFHDYLAASLTVPSVKAHAGRERPR